MPKTLRIEVSADHNPAATPVGGEYPVAFIRKRLLADEVYPSNVRANPTTGEVEFSPDGGITWIPSPESDPRLTTNRPVQVGAEAACKNAASEIAYLLKVNAVLQSVADPAITGTRVAYGMLVAFLELGQFYGILWGVFLAVATTLIGQGLSAINAAFDEANMDILLCILQCEFLFGALTGQSLENINNLIDAEMDSTSALILKAVLNLQGFGGINAAAALALVAEPDCSDCGCVWCYEFDFSLDRYGWHGSPFYSGGPNEGNYLEGVGWNPTFLAITLAGNDYANDANVQISIPGACVLTKIEATYSKTNGTYAGGTNTGAVGSYKGASFVGTTWSASGEANGSTIVRTWTGTRALAIGDVLSFFNRTCRDFTNPFASTGAMVLKKIRIEGTGTGPFGASGC